MKDPTDIISVVREFFGALREHRNLGHLWLGFSGGADSTALAFAMHLAQEPFTAVHIHHHIRKADADADAAWCVAFCREHSIPFRRIDVDVPGQMLPGESLEQAARRCRQEVWAGLTDDGDSVLLAHHLDDCLENLFLRLGRGSNCSGLSGLRPIARVGHVEYLRPLLSARRAQLEQFLPAHGITEWRQDSSNADTALRRNAVRHELLPAFERIFATDRGLVRALHALSDDAEFIEEHAVHAAAATQSLSQWQVLPPALLGRVLRLWLTKQTGEDLPLRAAGIERLEYALANWKGDSQIIPLDNQRTICLGLDGLYLQETAVLLPHRSWRWEEMPELPLPEIGKFLRADIVADASAVTADQTDAHEEFFARQALPSELEVRSWVPGDRLICFGARTAKKVQDIFTDDHVARKMRSKIPVLLADDRIIWLAGIRRAEFGRVGARDSKVVRITLLG